MISGSRCRHLKIAGRFDSEVSSPYQPDRLIVATHPLALTSPAPKNTYHRHAQQSERGLFRHWGARVAKYYSKTVDI